VNSPSAAILRTSSCARSSCCACPTVSTLRARATAVRWHHDVLAAQALAVAGSKVAWRVSAVSGTWREACARHGC